MVESEKLTSEQRKQSNIREKQLGEIKAKTRNRNFEGTVLLLSLTFTLQPVWLGRSYQEYENPASTAIGVNVARNPLTTKRWHHTGRHFVYTTII